MNVNSRKKALQIVVLAFDWRNLYENNPGEIVEKLNRDKLNPEFNTIFSIAWGPQGYCKEISPNIKTVHLRARVGRNRVLYDIVNIFVVPFILRKHAFKPDVVLVYSFASIVGGLYAKWFLGSKIIAVVTNIPRGLIQTRRFKKLSSVYQSISEFFAKRFTDHFIVISETTKAYVKSLGIPEQGIDMFHPNTILRDEAFIRAAQKGFVRRKYSIADDKKIILSVGRLEEEKNFPVLLRAFAEINNDSLTLVIVGEGRKELELKTLAKKLKLGGKVIFAGSLPRSDVWNYYKDADVFVLPSKSEGLGLVFWEAMYMHVPVIGAHVEGIAETIGTDGERGFFWQEDMGAKALEGAMKKCLEESAVTKKITEDAYEYVIRKIAAKKDINDIIG